MYTPEMPEQGGYTFDALYTEEGCLNKKETPF
jgi:hypothetical protein